MIENLVSIVTPVYNGAHQLPETIASVRAQTWIGWEMLVVDDRSTDGTTKVVEEIAREDPRVRLLRQPQNGGPGRARNAGLAAAKGRYVAFLDHDDLWLPQKLERQLEAVRTTSAGLCYTAFRRFPAEGGPAGRLVPVPATIDYRGLLRNTVIVTSSVLVDREVTGPIESRPVFHDDYVLWLSILKRGIRSVGLSEDLVRYRTATASYSRNKRRMAWNVWRTHRDIEELALLDACWCFANYAWNAWRKYRRY